MRVADERVPAVLKRHVPRDAADEGLRRPHVDPGTAQMEVVHLRVVVDLDLVGPRRDVVDGATRLRPQGDRESVVLTDVGDEFRLGVRGRRRAEPPCRYSGEHEKSNSLSHVTHYVIPTFVVLDSQGCSGRTPRSS